jgi:hypothetical protein
MKMIEDGVIGIGMEHFPLPSIEQAFEENTFGEEGDGAHRLASPRLKLSRAERVASASENARRTNTNTNVDALPEIPAVGDVTSIPRVSWHDDFH